MPDFNRLNPYTALIYFVCVVFFSIVFTHPLFVAVNVVASFAACLCICKKEILALCKYTLLMAAVITFVNPVFSTGGETVLLRPFGRPYTLQALIYGAVLAGIFICSINWFCCLGKVLTSEKFMYIFGGRFPNLCTILSTVLTLVPYFSAKLAEISGTQINIIPDDNGKIKGYFRSFNVAVSYAFEHAVNLAVSMKNRGFGTGKTTHYLNYKFKNPDIVIISASAGLTAAVLASIYSVGVDVQIIPALQLAPMGGVQWLGFGCYVALLAVPVIMKVISEIKWKSLMSKI